MNGLALGATAIEGAVAFLVWAPNARVVEVELSGRRIPLRAEALGYFAGQVPGAGPGDRYWFVLDGRDRLPDPASRAQPDGVHGPSAVVESCAAPDDRRWRPPPLSRWVIYELHVGTFTREGTFAAAIEALPRLCELGVSAIELMPVAAFPGARNWGYDGVFPYAVHEAYGGVSGLRAFVRACHRAGLAVVLDVVYNHLGPEGCVLPRFGPYTTGRYHTPWGHAINYDGPGSDEVRRYFIDNALMWLDELGVDGLRLDAVHAIVDPTPRPFLAELSERVEALVRADGCPRVLIAESDANDPRLVRPRASGGLGLHAVWADDFHHALHVRLTSDRRGVFADFDDPWLLTEAITEGFAYRGQYSRFRRRRHGAPTEGLSPATFVVCTQNHDQVGNQAGGARLGGLTTLAGQRLAAALLLTSPHVPLLFMGQEYGERRPFAYFTSHGDPKLAEAVRKGRRKELRQLLGSVEARGGELEDPQQESTFEGSRIEPSVIERSPHRELWALYRRLLRFRRAHGHEFVGVRPRCELHDGDHVLVVHLGHHERWMLVANLSAEERRILLPLGEGRWTCVIEGEDPCFGGRGQVLDPMRPSSDPIVLPGAWFAVLRRLSP
ncbi:malto-oligosyltrehalose trehalohydrolase [Paraliomyxa miuraensis]|uniref:malto-oligosyltrehalose trehalohydrolase n=1 Tax=Paraliomyxa miuraensis TaxID=376150 RepID=UPI002252AFBE|nr:malto-oligosyltrehalose trehalohydrolase [Paraliomyxa miuraensis]MCX4241036.1 malto-oligosyltrehalose trehalohydrolase [Paraliomyxa miuraensis]